MTLNQSNATDALDQALAVLKGATDNTSIGNILDALKIAVCGGNAMPMISRTDVSAQLITATGVSATFDTVGFGAMAWNVSVSAASGTSPKLDIQLQASDDNVNWSPVHDTQRFTSTGAFRLQGVRFSGRYYRYAYTVSGTTPSFTVSIIVTLKAYMPNRTASLFKYSDIDTTVNGNLSSVFSAATCENIACQIVRPADGKAAVKLRLQASIDGVFYDDITADVSIVSGTTTIQTLSAQAFRFYRWKVTTQVSLSQAPDIYWHANGGS